MDYSSLRPPTDYDQMLEYLRRINRGEITPQLTRPEGLPQTPNLPVPTIRNLEAGPGYARGQATLPIGRGHISGGFTRYPGQTVPEVGAGYRWEY